MQVLEQEDKTLIRMNLKEVPEDFKKAITERMQHSHGMEQHEHSIPLQGFLTMKETTIDLTVLISKSKEIEEITFTVNGFKNEEQNAAQLVNLQGVLRFAW